MCAKNCRGYKDEKKHKIIFVEILKKSLHERNGQMKIQRSIFFLFCAIFSASFILSAYATPEPAAYGWYIVRNSEHKQPTLDAHMQFIEDHNAYYLDRSHGDDCEEKVIYLTFDAGYENGNISKILDTLDAHGAKAAFFILDHMVKKETALVKRMASSGHTVCNHSMSHRDMSTLSRKEFTDELLGLETLYTEYTGAELAKYYRPPEGRFTEENLEWADSLGFKTVFWSFAYADWDNNKQMSGEAAKEKILSNIHNGAILLLHPTSATNAAILDSVLSELESEGYRFGTLDELPDKVG